MVKTKGKHEFIKIATETMRKSKKIIMRLPNSKMKDIKLALNDLDVSFQDAYDCLVVGGLCMKRPEMIEFVRKHKEKYAQISRDACKARLAGAKGTISLDRYNMSLSMYEYDFKAFSDYIIEENIKKQWVYEILFIDGILEKAPEVISMLDRNKELDIKSRKQIARRISEDKYITALGPREAQKLLKAFTKDYEKREYESKLFPEVYAKESLEQDDVDIEELELDKQLEKINKERKKAERELRSLEEEYIDE